MTFRNHVSTLDADLLSREAQHALKSLVSYYDPLTGTFPGLGGGSVPANLSAGASSATVFNIANSNGTGVAIPSATQVAAGVMSAADKTKVDSFTAISYTGTWAGKPGAPALNDRIRVTDVHPTVSVDFTWNGTAWVRTSECPAVRDVYVQASDGSTWAARPTAATLNIPVWANKVRLIITAGAVGGGSGRRGATATARSGGQGGPGGNTAGFVIPLRNTDGSLIAASGTFTIGAGTAGGAAVTVNDTNGNASVGGTQQSTFALAGVTYRAPGGGSAASGGANAAITTTTTGLSNSFPPPYAWGSTSVTAAGATQFFNNCTSAGGGGGSIDTGNVLLTPAGIAQVGRAEGVITTAGTLGSYEIQGDLIIARPPIGGAASSTADAQAGGQGLAGCGGAGGGASLNGFNSGAGGRGGDGWAIFIWE